jgi:hypothetical protein
MMWAKHKDTKAQKVFESLRLRGFVLNKAQSLSHSLFTMKSSEFCKKSIEIDKRTAQAVSPALFWYYLFTTLLRYDDRGAEWLGGAVIEAGFVDFFHAHQPFAFGHYAGEVGDALGIGHCVQEPDRNAFLLIRNLDFGAGEWFVQRVGRTDGRSDASSRVNCFEGGHMHRGRR